MVKELPLTQGKVAIVDDWNYAKALKHKWCAVHIRSYYYAVTNIKKSDGKRKLLYLHRFIMNCPPDKEIDHRNHNTLDCRKSNLRFATRSQNQMNSRPRKNTSSRFKGVYWYKKYKKWRAYIQPNLGSYRAFYSLGYFSNEIDAARAYDTAAEAICGEFAGLNFPRDTNIK